MLKLKIFYYFCIGIELLFLTTKCITNYEEIAGGG